MNPSTGDLTEIPSTKIVVHAQDKPTTEPSNLSRALILPRTATASHKIQLADRLPLPKSAKVDEKLLVLEEEDYVNNMEYIIARDYFPAVFDAAYDHTGKKDSQTPVESHLLGETLPSTALSLQQYVTHVTSEDNQSMQRMLVKEAQEKRLRQWWMREPVEKERMRVALGGVKGWESASERNSLMFLPDSHDDATRYVWDDPDFALYVLHSCVSGLQSMLFPCVGS